ncbi:MAG: thrombospondin type 3 repeat-containing protein [Gammaproteobacteria bacterium]|nr:thrombospondin type 3 repeat-containing protein [Gammaproteobacteria bacterium]
MQKISVAANGLVKSITTSILRATSVRLTTLVSLLLATLVLAACGGGGGGGGASGPGIQVTNLKAIPGSGSLTLTWDNPNANISSFDIEVRNLATNDVVAAASQASITTPAVNTTAPLATAGYTIPSGLVDDGKYSVAVTVNLQGADAGRATSARGLSGRRVSPANGVRIGANEDGDQYADAEDNCPAIKNDDQANAYGGPDNIGDVCGDLDADTIVDADDNCLVKYNSDQLDDNGNGVGDACDAVLDSDGDGMLNTLDNCPFIANLNQEDGDMDNVGDPCDVDADGNRLIEISTVAQLNMMRYNLGGTGLDDGTSDTDNTAGGDSNGCGVGMTASGAAISNCNGYEQMVDINLEDLGRDASGSNWEPVGNCENTFTCGARSVDLFFSGIFSGNHFTISNLFIHVNTARSGVGFFGAISSTAQLRNINIRGGNITINETALSAATGGLVGFGDSAIISNSSVTLDAINGRSGVGGLVGDGDGTEISSSVATVGEITGSDNVGGLAGNGLFATISSSVATVGEITGLDNVGGLAGSGLFATISSSVATVGEITGSDNVGGLVGNGNDTIISSSVATVGEITGSDNVGGLAGNGDGTEISSSVAVTNNITGASDVGGLLGLISSTTSVTDSYWDANVSFADGVMPLPGNTAGSDRTPDELRNPTTFRNIYANWGNAYCDPNTGEYFPTAPNPRGDFIRIWDLGTDAQYPALNCVNHFFSLADQRAVTARVAAGESPIQ